MSVCELTATSRVQRPIFRAIVPRVGASTPFITWLSLRMVDARLVWVEHKRRMVV